MKKTINPLMDVYVRRVTDLVEDTEYLLNQMKWKQIIKKGDRVLVKPNFCAGLERGVTTDMGLLKNIVTIVKGRTDDVTIVESESPFKDLDRMIEGLDIDCEKINLSKVETRQFKKKYGLLEIPERVFDSKIINVPVLKTHVLTDVTIGIKNLYGFVPDPGRARYHYSINSVLSDILDLIRPEINILDAIYSMDKKGPNDGRVLQTNFIMASRDVVSLDMAACEIIGADYSAVEHIKNAKERYHTKFDIKGDDLSDLEQFKLPGTRGVQTLIVQLERFGPSRRLLGDSMIRAVGKRVLGWFT